MKLNESHGLKTEINYTLLKQMKQLISNAAKTASSVSFIPLFDFIPTQQTLFDFSYPGEVLQRYEQKYEGPDIKNTRALAIALLECKDILVADMFIANQYVQFISKIRRYAKTDLYLTGVLYHLTKKEEEKKDLFNFLLYYPYQKTHEIIFTLYILQEEETAWELLSNYLVLYLGKKRTLYWYENLPLLSWLIRKYSIHVKNYKKRDFALLKALFALPYKHIKRESPIWNQLKEHGYSQQEILYINLKIPNQLSFGKVLQTHSITMERMAVEALERILNAEVVEDTSLYTLCEHLINEYKSFTIKLQGKIGILDILNHRITVKNETTFLFLWAKKEINTIPENFFYIDMAEDNKWDNLVNHLSQEKYREQFELCFIYMHQNAKTFSTAAWLNKYETLTGEKYENIFWMRNHSNASSIFSILVKEKKIDLLHLFDEYQKDVKVLSELERTKKWSSMSVHIYKKTKNLNAYEDYVFWQKFISSYSINELDTFFNHKDVFYDAFIKESYQYYQHAKQYTLNIIRSFLTVEEQFTLIYQLENYIFINKTEFYVTFLIKLLCNVAIRNTFPEECRELFLMLQTYYKDNYSLYSLRKYYYTKQELEEFQNKEIEEKNKEKETKRKEQIKELNHILESTISKSQNKIEDICNLLKKNYDNLALITITNFLLTELEKERAKISPKIIYSITGKLLKSYHYNDLPWSLFQSIVARMEELLDE